jgi:hypothetical protein
MRFFSLGLGLFKASAFRASFRASESSIVSLHSSAVSTLIGRFSSQSILIKPTASQQKLCFSVLQAGASCHGNDIATRARRFSYDGEPQSHSFFDVRIIAAAVGEPPYHP